MVLDDVPQGATVVGVAAKVVRFRCEYRGCECRCEEIEE